MELELKLEVKRELELETSTTTMAEILPHSLAATGGASSITPASYWALLPRS